MIYKTCAIVMMACLSLTCKAQDDTEITEKKVNHYIGIQINQLVRQIFNFSNNNAAINNPYLINYSLVFGPKQIGFNIGSGYTFDEIKTGDATNELTTKVNNTFFRIGFEKKSSIGKNWLFSVGADVLLDKQKDESTSKITFGGNGKIVTTSSSTVKGTGFGPRITLSYQISNRILIGTEATYYFKSLKDVGEVVIATTSREFDPVTGQERNVTRTERTENDDELKKLQFNVPAVLWLHVKF
jgi:hypothetical protein